MAPGTLHWVPLDPGKQRRTVRFTRSGLGLSLLTLALFLSVTIGGTFLVGRAVGRKQMRDTHTIESEILRSELIQLELRVGNISRTLEEVAEREERIVMAASDLNLDFSSFLPDDRSFIDIDQSGIFDYVDDIELRLLLAERLASAELAVYDSLALLFVEMTAELRTTPSIWPSDGIFVSDFGPRLDPFTGAVRYHKGIDIAALTGTPIYAPADGVVIFAGWTGGWGLNLRVRHSEHVSTRFAHCSSIETSVGQQVHRGDLIARIGSTGRSIAAHLHYEVLIDGVQVDPEDYIIRAGPSEAAF
jgi:murein DD-endopeptidase MepM/ murein hydrolase activator NlpD